MKSGRISVCSVTTKCQKDAVIFMNSESSFAVHPVGFVNRKNNHVELKVLKPYVPALKQLDKFSHVIVLWWADKHDNDKARNTMQCELPYAPGTIAGVFACRAKYRPNPIAMTTCKILKVDEVAGIVHVANIDAFEGTPLLDLKGYIPVCDRVRDVHVPL
jgi:tRNA-Thr(GGU) m(6)t(6)A37 methyltransferase TsaA